MTEITVEKLLDIGCKKFVNNPGTKYEYAEYYLPLTGDGIYMNESRISAEDHRRIDGGYPVVVLRAPGVIYFMSHIRTIEQFEQIYALLSGRGLPLSGKDK